MSVGSDGGKGEGGGAGGGKGGGFGEEMLDGIEEVEQVERAEGGKEWRSNQQEVHAQRRTWKEREQLMEQLVTQMETMRECCALALMAARQREQQLALARDRAGSVLDDMQRNEARQRDERKIAYADMSRLEEALEDAVSGVERTLGVVCARVESDNKERRRMESTTRELRRALEVEEQEMQQLQRKMSLAMLWASD